jgi:hypothetical protein
MINFNKLKNIDYIREKQAALLIARREASPEKQKIINIELDIIYQAKYNILKGI